MRQVRTYNIQESTLEGRTRVIAKERAHDSESLVLQSDIHIGFCRMNRSSPGMSKGMGVSEGVEAGKRWVQIPCRRILLDTGQRLEGRGQDGSLPLGVSAPSHDARHRGHRTNRNQRNLRARTEKEGLLGQWEPQT